VDEGSGSTIGSSLKYPLNTTSVVGGPNVTQYIMNSNGGAVEYTTLNTLADAELTTILQSNTISMTGYKNIYIVSTLFYNTTLQPPQTQCVGTDILYDPSLTDYATVTVPGVPASTSYTYTETAFTYDANFTLTTILDYGLDLLATAVGSALHLSSACIVGGGGGVGTLKVPVTALTIDSIVYVTAQAVSVPLTTTTALLPQPTESSAKIKDTVTLPSPAPVSSVPPVVPPATSVAAPVFSLAIVLPPTPPSTSAAVGVPPSNSPSQVTAILLTTSGSAGLQTLSTAVALPTSPITTTLVFTTSGASGLETFSTVVGLPAPTTNAPTPTPALTTILVTTSLLSLGLQTLSTVLTLPASNTISPTAPISTILVFTSAGQTFSLTTTLPPATPISATGSYITTLVETTSGPSGLETLSEVTTLPLGSVILSVMGISAGNPTTTTETGTQTATAAPGFTGGGVRREPRMALILVGVLVGILI
jgi:hypothetical protein